MGSINSSVYSASLWLNIVTMQMETGDDIYAPGDAPLTDS